VYASEFLGPLEGRLRGLSVEAKDERQWIGLAAQRIKEVLRDRLRDELFITEAQSSLNPEQKKGLLHFIDTVRDNLVSTAGAGAAVAADEAYRERNEGQGLDAQVQKHLDQEMVNFQVQSKVVPLVNVSWRDVQLEYNRRYAEFNPPPTAMFLVIYIPDNKPEVLSEFTRRIEAGEDFAELAARPENEFPDKGAWPRKFEREFAEGKFFAYPEYEDAAHHLKPGQTSPPIRLKNRTAWIHLDKIETPDSKSLYDVQLSLFNELHRQRLQQEADRYFARLMNKASFSDLNAMVARLVSIAHDRYYVAQK
jgi:parvulin-like peptidyl-prolyl isomerase